MFLSIIPFSDHASARFALLNDLLEFVPPRVSPVPQESKQLKRLAAQDNVEAQSILMSDSFSPGNRWKLWFTCLSAIKIVNRHRDNKGCLPDNYCDMFRIKNAWTGRYGSVYDQEPEGLVRDSTAFDIGGRFSEQRLVDRIRQCLDRLGIEELNQLPAEAIQTQESALYRDHTDQPEYQIRLTGRRPLEDDRIPIRPLTIRPLIRDPSTPPPTYTAVVDDDLVSNPRVLRKKKVVMKKGGSDSKAGKKFTKQSKKH
jgi:hypothetical protein